MSIVAMNEIVAVVSDIEDASNFNAKKAISELSRVRDWGQMVSFIDNHCINELFVLTHDVFRGVPYIGSYCGLIHKMPGKSLPDTLSRPDMPDYLDGIDEHQRFTCPADYQGRGFGFLSVCDLLAIRHVISSITRTGAAALSFPPTDGLCTFYSDDNLPEDPDIRAWIREEHGTCKLIVKIDSCLSGFSRFGILDAEEFEEAEIDTNQYAQWGNYFVFDEHTSKSNAAKIALGQVAAWAINHYQHWMLPELFPYAEYESCNDISFDLAKGFHKESLYSLQSWDDVMMSALKDALLSQRVALCEVCHEPFIAERKDKVHGCCSNACRQRKWQREHLRPTPAPRGGVDTAGWTSKGKEERTWQKETGA